MLFATLAVPRAQYPLSHAASFGRNIKKYLKPPFIKYGKAAGSITFITTYWTSVGIFKFLPYTLCFENLNLKDKLNASVSLAVRCFLLLPHFFVLCHFFVLLAVTVVALLPQDKSPYFLFFQLGIHSNSQVVSG